VSAEPNVDGFNFTGNMVAVYDAGTHNDVPLISGMNNKDIDNPAAGLGITGLINEMPWLASKRTSNTYVYNFNKVPVNWAAQNVGAYHGIELAYLFNYPGSLYSHYLLGLTGLTVDRTKLPTAVIAESGYGAADVAVADNMMTMWTNFAKTGSPSTTTFSWPVYTAGSDAYAEIGTAPVAKTGLATAFQP
jgi:para-nitrobenzyl esterase